MKTLITPGQVVTLAFTDGEYVAEQCVTEADIAAAELRYIVPVVGRELHARLLDGGYPDFVTDYLAAPAALFTRLLVQPGLDIRTGQCGSVAPRSASFQPAAEAQLHRLRQMLRVRARTLLGRASDHLKQCAGSFPEYDDESNILNRCTLGGGFVQVR